MAEQSTIFALSSGAGKAGVAVLRVSGLGAGAAANALTGGRRPPARSAVVRTLRHPLSGAALDQALVLWLPGPGSFTGEDCVEFHVHGGRAVVAAMLDALGRIDGLRLAEAGEFTRRAFFNGKLDLTEAEALADLVDADTEAQRLQALKAVTGDGLGAAAERWRSGIIRALALCEAAIDFSDEGDVADSAVAQAEEIARELHRDLRRALDDGRRGEIIRDGFKVAIVGEPNVGKSSLLNALTRRDAAIVSDEPGTTRDVIEVTMDLGGFVVVLADTAGLRETTGLVEREGIRRSIQAAEAADLVLLVTAAEGLGSAFSPELHRNLENLSAPVLRVRNKIDVAPEGQNSSCIGISARTGEGIADLLAEIERLARSRADVGEASLITRARHRDHLALGAQALEVFIAEEDRALELRAEDLRIGSLALGRLTGRIDAEDVLGEIFGRFCIGK